MCKQNANRINIQTARRQCNTQAMGKRGEARGHLSIGDDGAVVALKQAIHNRLGHSVVHLLLGRVEAEDAVEVEGVPVRIALCRHNIHRGLPGQPHQSHHSTGARTRPDTQGGHLSLSPLYA